MVNKGTNISGNEQERHEAHEMGYDNVGSHPRHIGVPEAGELLVIDGDNILFDDLAEAVQAAVEHARRGVRVAIHTYTPDDPRLAPAHAEPNITVGKTHQEVLAALESRSRVRSVGTGEAASNATEPQSPLADEDDLLLWLGAAQAEIDAKKDVEPARST